MLGQRVEWNESWKSIAARWSRWAFCLVISLRSFIFSSILFCLLVSRTCTLHSNCFELILQPHYKNYRNIMGSNQTVCRLIFAKLDQNNLAFNIHEIPSTISLDTPSERSGSRQEPFNHDQNLPNGNLLRETILNITPTLTNEPDEAQQPNYRSKLTIMEPRDSICWYQSKLIFIVDFF